MVNGLTDLLSQSRDPFYVYCLNCCVHIYPPAYFVDKKNTYNM